MILKNKVLSQSGYRLKQGKNLYLAKKSEYIKSVYK